MGLGEFGVGLGKCGLGLGELGVDFGGIDFGEELAGGDFGLDIDVEFFEVAAGAGEDGGFLEGADIAGEEKIGSGGGLSGRGDGDDGEFFGLTGGIGFGCFVLFVMRDPANDKNGGDQDEQGMRVTAMMVSAPGRGRSLGMAFSSIAWGWACCLVAARGGCGDGVVLRDIIEAPVQRGFAWVFREGDCK